MAIEQHRIEAAARAIAAANGDDFDTVPTSKEHWTNEGGIFNERFRDINEPMRLDYIAMAEHGLATGFPELSAGTAWVAPWEANGVMTEAGSEK